MKSFLVVEDDGTISELCGLLIRRHYDNVHVDYAVNGIDALSRVDKLDYTVILSDIEMPGMNGVDFYRRLEEEHPHLARRVAFLSANLYEPHVSFLRKENIPHLAKPFVRPAFYGIIDSILESETRRFIEEHGRECMRKHSRFRVEEDVVVHPSATDSCIKISVHGNTVNHSDDGICLFHEGHEIEKGCTLQVTVEALDIIKRSANVAWSLRQGYLAKTGLQWVE